MKCADCQFLALRNRFTGRLDLAGDEYRVTGEAPYFRRTGAQLAPFRDRFEYPYANAPCCYIGARDLLTCDDPQAVLAYLKADRECPPFVSYRSTPAGQSDCAQPEPMAWRIAAAIRDAVLGREHPAEA